MSAAGLQGREMKLMAVLILFAVEVTNTGKFVCYGNQFPGELEGYS